jgi:hypothetical protein
MLSHARFYNPTDTDRKNCVEEVNREVCDEEVEREGCGEEVFNREVCSEGGRG